VKHPKHAEAPDPHQDLHDMTRDNNAPELDVLVRVRLAVHIHNQSKATARLHTRHSLIDEGKVLVVRLQRVCVALSCFVRFAVGVKLRAMQVHKHHVRPAGSEPLEGSSHLRRHVIRVGVRQRPNGAGGCVGRVARRVHTRRATTSCAVGNVGRLQATTVGNGEHNGKITGHVLHVVVRSKLGRRSHTAHSVLHNGDHTKRQHNGLHRDTRGHVYSKQEGQKYARCEVRSQHVCRAA